MFSLSKSTCKKPDVIQYVQLHKFKDSKAVFVASRSISNGDGVSSRNIILEPIFHDIVEYVYPYKFESIWYSFHLANAHTTSIFQ